jgi:MFS family permease
LFNDSASEMVSPLIPAFLTSVLGVGAIALGALEGFAEALASILKLVSGRLSDKYGSRKGLTVLGYAIPSVARPLIAITTAFWQLFTLRMFDRIGKGIRSAPRDAMIADLVPLEIRGRAYGFQRALDHLGAVIGPLLAAAILWVAPNNLRLVFGLAAIPMVGALLILILAVKEKHRQNITITSFKAKLNPTFWKYLACVFIFTLGNSSDAFLLLRAQNLGVHLALIPLLWSAFHVVKSVTSTPAGKLSDSWGRFNVILLGWGWYGLVYLGFAFAKIPLHIWGLFLLYGLYFGLTEGVERAYVVDLVGEENRGTAFGWFHLTVGIGALPASLIFGAIWQTFGPHIAFIIGACLAVIASFMLAGMVRKK